MELDLVVCYIERAVVCRNAEAVIEGSDLFYMLLPARTPVMFIHGINKLPLCQGWGFQVHVWGDEKYTIWVLDEGRTPCLILNDVYVDVCNENIYAISSRHDVCNTLDLIPCEVELAELLKTLGYPLFVLVDYDKNVPLINAVNHANIVECAEKKNKLLKEYIPKG